MPQKVIAIDGPSASGKGTVAQRVADALGWRYLDSGALYRITALYARNRRTAWDNEAAVAALAQALPVEFVEGAVLLDGEDVSAAISVVFPDAVLKVFLTASPQVRAERRAKQIGVPLAGAGFERILADIEARDEADRNRTVAPLQKLPEAHLLDTSALTIEESVKKVLDWYREK